MKKLIYYVACSADRLIAREDGALDDFTADGEQFADLLKAFPETIPGHLREPLGVDGGNERFDTVLMGRRTYEVGLASGVTSPYPHLRQYLFSHSLDDSPDQEIQVVSNDAIDVVRRLKKNVGKDIWLCGGGNLASTLFSEIDEVILKVNPFLMGQGIPLFEGSLPKTTLELLSHRVYDNGFMILHYQLLQ